MPEPERVFYYMPFEHSENLEDQALAVTLLLTSRPSSQAAALSKATVEDSAFPVWGGKVTSLKGYLGNFVVTLADAAIVRDSDEFKLNCNLVVIDFLIRHGWIDPRSPEYLALVLGLLLVSAALLSMALLRVDSSYVAIAWRLVLMAVGMGLVMAAHFLPARARQMDQEIQSLVFMR